MENIYKSDFGNFDISRESILLITLNGIDPTIDQVNEYCDIQDRITPFYKNKFVCVVDSRKAKWINSKSRIHIGKRTNVSQESIKDRNVKVFVVISNPVLKLIMKGINIVAKPVVPQVICTTMEEAMGLAEKEIKLF